MHVHLFNDFLRSRDFPFRPWRPLAFDADDILFKTFTGTLFLPKFVHLKQLCVRNLPESVHNFKYDFVQEGGLDFVQYQHLKRKETHSVDGWRWGGRRVPSRASMSRASPLSLPPPLPTSEPYWLLTFHPQE